MSTNKTITINGRAYDAVTGLPISERVYDQVSRVPNNKVASKAQKTPEAPEKEPTKPKPAIKRDAPTAAAQVHSQTQRSQTLLRRITKKPAAAAKRPTTGRHMDMARSTKVSKFAPHPVVTPVAVAAPKVAPKPDKPAQIHPMVAKAVARVAAAKPVVHKQATSKEVKNEEIAKALATPKAKPRKTAKKMNKLQRRLLIIAGVILALALTAYAVYRFVPAVSVSFASVQAGVEATYPEFVPDGYSLDHPVTFTDGQVALKFKQNGNKENSYTITQTRSSWDSSAILDNVVRPDSGENYITTKERGLTVYSYGNNAAWVNGGVMYVISSSSAPLSGEQIRHIATSL